MLDLIAAAGGDLNYWALMDLQPPRTWFRGRVVRAGASIHGRLPHQGMGGGMGVESGYALGILLARMGIGRYAAAFEAFVRLRAAQTRKVGDGGTASRRLAPTRNCAGVRLSARP